MATHIQDQARNEAQYYNPVPEAILRDDVIEITVTNSVATLTKSSPDRNWDYRTRVVLMFFEVTCYYWL